jgi:hypothetical protein
MASVTPSVAGVVAVLPLSPPPQAAKIEVSMAKTRIAVRNLFIVFSLYCFLPTRIWPYHLTMFLDFCQLFCLGEQYLAAKASKKAALPRKRKGG